MIRPVAMLPNILTTMNLCCGFWAMTLCLDGTPDALIKACCLVILAAVFDTLDGRVARWAKVSSKFGVELDSLADLLSFGAAPAFIAYTYGLRELGAPGRLVAMAFATCGALRLARFNVGSQDEKPASAYFFTGSPIPAAAGLIVALLLYVLVPGKPLPPEILAGFMIYASIMMVSTFPYPSAKKPPTTKSGKMLQALFLASVFFGLVVYRQNLLIAIGIAYMASGPLWSAYRFVTAALRGGTESEVESTADREDPGSP